MLEASSVTNARIAYSANARIRNMIARIGRTEDIKFSPTNDSLAILDYFGKCIYLFSVQLENSATYLSVNLTDYSIITSESLHETHGVAFLGNNHIIVCNRSGDVCIFKIPLPNERPHNLPLEPRARIRGNGLFRAKVITPGSVDCYQISKDCYRVLVCNNSWNIITSHLITLGNAINIRHEGILIEQQLRIPDGVSISNDGAWIAVSNHVDGEVLIYENSPHLSRATPPSANLRGIVCPHGVRFTSDGRVFVADAASQYLHIYERNNDYWSGNIDPVNSVRVINDETFYLGRYDSREGGVKGIDIDNSNRILVTTHKLDVLGFYDVAKMTSHINNIDPVEFADLCHQRDRSLRINKHQSIKRRLTIKSRIKNEISDLRRKWRRRKDSILTQLQTYPLYIRNKWSRESILSPDGPVLSLTTHAFRQDLVFLAIESIARGHHKPSHVHLWITDKEAYTKLPSTLQRLKSRGLEVHLTDDFGPHTKYYPYLCNENCFVRPLVTADDDVIYPREWLQQLITAYESNPSVIHCFRAHRMHLAMNRPAPYNSWAPCSDKIPSHLNFITGVSGVIYPPNYLHYLKEQGQGFLSCCPNADDIWLTITALRAGFKIAQINDKPGYFTSIPGSQRKRLYNFNVRLGENQIQLMRTISESDLTMLLSDQKVSGALINA